MSIIRLSTSLRTSTFINDVPGELPRYSLIPQVVKPEEVNVATTQGEEQPTFSSTKEVPNPENEQVEEVKVEERAVDNGEIQPNFNSLQSHLKKDLAPSRVLMWC